MIPACLTPIAMAAKAVATAAYVLVISSNVANYNIFNAAKAAGWNGTSATTVQVTVNSGVYVYSSTTATPAMDTGNGWPTGSSITIFNNGYIVGAGGAGGAGQATANANGIAGSAGGIGLKLQITTSITNNGTIAGGGGGGGSGGNCFATLSGAGGAGQSYNMSAGATGGTNQTGTYADGAGGVGGTPGNAGSVGQLGPYQLGGGGGGGGGWGGAGGAGANVPGSGSVVYSGGAGGAAGYYVSGNSYATWTSVGTRYGLVV